MSSPRYAWRLPWPPSINHYYRHTRNGHFITREGRLYRSAVIAAVGAIGKPLEGALALSVRLYMPDKRRRDIDNVLKALQDALQAAGAYYDDCQISLLCVQKRENIPGGACEVELSPLAEKRCSSILD
jgi:crossover junction endodeoxyribonuclease RusA